MKWIKKLKRKLTYTIWRTGYVKFETYSDTNKLKIYWPKYTTFDFTTMLEVLHLIHDKSPTSVKKIIREAVIKFGQDVDEVFFAYFLLNRLDGIDIASAYQFAMSGMYNQEPPEDEKDKPSEISDESPKVTYLCPSMFHIYHENRGNL